MGKYIEYLRTVVPPHITRKKQKALIMHVGNIVRKNSCPEQYIFMTIWVHHGPSSRVKRSMISLTHRAMTESQWFKGSCAEHPLSVIKGFYL